MLLKKRNKSLTTAVADLQSTPEGIQSENQDKVLLWEKCENQTSDS
jgi:hypothetical protein